MSLMIRLALLTAIVAGGAWMIATHGHARPPSFGMDRSHAMLASWRADSTLRRPPLVGRSAGISAPLRLIGDVGFNVRAALDANHGALRAVTIPPGATWSFNAAVGDPRRLSLRTVSGVYGGGWCDLASRYVQAVRPILPPEAVQFVNHVQTNGVRLPDVADHDAVAIWNIDGQPGSFGGRLDLLITNVHATALRLIVVAGSAPETIVVHARLD